MKKNYIFAIIFLLVGGYFTSTMPFDSTLSWVSNISMVLLALGSFGALIKYVGVKRGVLALVLLSILGVLIEWGAVSSGFPYGKFIYGDKLGYKLFDAVPWTVPFAWVPLLIGGYAVARQFVKVFWCQLILAALLIVAADMVIDPGAVALQFWTWEVTDGFYGVPISNFVGWFFTALIGVIVLHYSAFTKNKVEELSRDSFVLLISGFLMSVIFWSTVDFVRNMYGAVAIGLGLIVFAIWNIRKYTNGKI
jgi:putative membrane protein